MALRNGLLVHGPTHWAAAVRDDAGEVRVASGRKPDLGSKAAENVPGVRGIVKLAEAMAVIPLVKRALPEAQLPMQDVRTLGAMGAAAVGGTAIRAAGVRRARAQTESTGSGKAFSAGPGSEAAIALLSLVPALMALRSGDLAAYHGVEHKSIAAYEDDGEAADATKEHDRCGSHLVAPMLTAAAMGNVAARRAGLRGPAAEAVVGLGERGRGRRGLRLGRAPPRVALHTAPAPARPRDPARAGMREPYRPARGGPRRARGDPARGGRWRLRLSAGPVWIQASFACPWRGSGRAGTPTRTSTSPASCSRRAGAIPA